MRLFILLISFFCLTMVSSYAQPEHVKERKRQHELEKKQRKNERQEIKKQRETKREKAKRKVESEGKDNSRKKRGESSSKSSSIPKGISASPNEIVIEAKKYLGVKYRTGGETPKGFDCSGFTQYIFSKFDKNQLPRRAKDQYKLGETISKHKAKVGDLVFFTTNGRTVGHVGIIVSEFGEPLTMIHASSSQGIIFTNLTESTYWRKKLKKIKRIANFTEN